jgi:membrane associated rhomboid family serine protease
VVIGLWIGIQIWQGAGSFGRLGNVGGVAYLAHVGGAASGLVVAYLFRQDARRLGQPTLFDRVR